MMNPKQAEELALMALGWIASDDERAGGFMGVSGASVEDLRSGAERPEFLGFVLDYLLMDDQYVLAFADEANVKPEAVMQARQALPGGDNPNWT